MKYKKFIIKQYKAITNPLEIDFSKCSLMPIIGINECGKTTILNAIMAFDFTNDQYDKIIKHLTDVNNLYSTKSEPAVISVSIEMTHSDMLMIMEEYIEKKNKGAEKKIEIKLPKSSKLKSDLVVTRTISSDKRTYSIENFPYKFIKDVNLFCEQLVRNLPYILYFDDFRDSFPDRIEIKKNNEVDGWISVIEELFNRTDEHYSVFNLKDLEKRQRNSVITDVERKLNKTLTREWANFKLDDRDSLEIKIDFDSVSESTDQSNEAQQKIVKNYLSFEVVEKARDGRQRSFFVKDRSKGFYWFFNFVMKLEFNPKVVNSDSNTIYLLDEPGSYLHPFAQNKLCKKLLELSVNNKVLYCTHTHYLLDPEVIPLNTIHIAHKDETQGISLTRCTSYPKSRSDMQSAYQPIFDALYLKPFNLDFSFKQILLVEGIYDYYSFSLFRTQDNYGIMPGRGANSLLGLISVLIGFNIEFKVLWDNDKEGGKQRKLAEDFFGEELASLRFFTLVESGSAKILQDMFDGDDIRLIKDRLYLPLESSFEKVISSLYYSRQRDTITNEISNKTKKRFKEVLSQIGLETSE